MTGDKVGNLFSSLNSARDLKKLISDGQEENSYLESKNPMSPQGFDRKLKSEVAQEISGFSNTGGGIIIFGVSTSPKQGMDILSQLEPIGLIQDFCKKVELSLPLLTQPPVNCELKAVKSKPIDTRGYAILFIPPSTGDPVRVRDGDFYLRVGDHSEKMPYETIKRMFVGGASPDLDALFNVSLIKKREDGTWKLPIAARNKANFPAKTGIVLVQFMNPSVCVNLTPTGFEDQSEVNVGKKTFICSLSKPVYKRLDMYVGDFNVKLENRKKLVKLRIVFYAENMVAREQNYNIYFRSRGKVTVKKMSEKLLY